MSSGSPSDSEANARANNKSSDGTALPFGHRERSAREPAGGHRSDSARGDGSARRTSETASEYLNRRKGRGRRLESAAAGAWSFNDALPFTGGFPVFASQRQYPPGDDPVHVVEAEGDAAFARARAPLFEKARQPHPFTPEERKRMDEYESIDYGEPQSLLYKSQVAAGLWQAAHKGRGLRGGWLRWCMFIAIGVVVGLWSVLLFQTLDYLADVKLASVQDSIRAKQREHERQHRGSKETPMTGSATAAAAMASVSPSLSSFANQTQRLLVAVDGGDAQQVDSSSSPPGQGAAGGGGDDGALVSLHAVLYGYGIFALWSVVAAMLSSLCCVVMPSAAGSGIPDVMAYLNGIMFPRIFNIRNLLTKTLSCILAVSAGLPVGTEGPMIHIGSLIGAGLPTGRSRSLHCSAASLFSGFRSAKDARDFISAGAACGLTAAFSSPLGGMLFVLEEIATFFPVRLAWMVLVSCLSCVCVTQYVNTHLSGWRLVGRTAERAGGPLSLGDFRDSAVAMFFLGTVPENRASMNLLTFLPTVIVAVVAGALAVMYTVSSTRLSRWRARRLFPKPVFRVLEPGVFAFLYATACYAVPLLFSSCRRLPDSVAANEKPLGVVFVTALCRAPPSLRDPPPRYYHPLATLAITSPYNLLRLLFSRQTPELFPPSALLVHLLLYTAGSSYAGGMFVSCGTVIPSLLIGAVTGRLVGELLQQSAWADPGVLALVGAAAYFSGISRLSFSLIVIMMELTADLTHVTCLMLAVFLAKGIADGYCHSLYASTLEAKAAPLLELQSNMHEYDTFSAGDIATRPVVTLSLTETVVHVLEVLHGTTHNAFPVVSPRNGTYAGMIARTQLQQLLWVMCFRGEEEAGDEAATAARGQREEAAPSALSPRQQRRERWLSSQRHATSEELAAVKETVFWERLPAMPPPDCLPMDVSQSFVDLTPYVDLSPYYVLEVTCVSRTYYLFRHLGLRHLPVLDRHMRVSGILTRTCFVGDRLQERVAEAAQSGSAQRPHHSFFGLIR